MANYFRASSTWQTETDCQTNLFVLGTSFLIKCTQHLLLSAIKNKTYNQTFTILYLWVIIIYYNIIYISNTIGYPISTKRYVVIQYRIMHYFDFQFQSSAQNSVLVAFVLTLVFFRGIMATPNISTDAHKFSQSTLLDCYPCL